MNKTKTKVIFNGAVGRLLPLDVMLDWSTKREYYGLVPDVEYDPRVHRKVRITIEEVGEPT